MTTTARAFLLILAAGFMAAPNCSGLAKGCSGCGKSGSKAVRSGVKLPAAGVHGGGALGVGDDMVRLSDEAVAVAPRRIDEVAREAGGQALEAGLEAGLEAAIDEGDETDESRQDLEAAPSSSRSVVYQLSIERIHTHNGLNAALTRRLVEEALPAMERCFIDALNKRRRVPPTVKPMLMVGLQGGVKRASAVTLGDKKLGRCLEGHLKGLPFPVPAEQIYGKAMLVLNFGPK